MRIAVSGARGFVGKALVAELSNAGHLVHAISRTQSDQASGASLAWFHAYDAAGLQRAFERCDAVVHLAAKVHDVSGVASAEEYSAANIQLSEDIARAAVSAGVRRLVVASTVKTFADSTLDASAGFRPPNSDAYGKSKLMAEERVRAIVEGTEVDVVVLRFPLVYGPGMRANMLVLADAVRRGVRIPTPRPANARSVVYIGNATAAIRSVVEHSGRVSGVFTVTDGAPLSTHDIASGFAAGMGVNAKTLAIPARVARLVRGVARSLGTRGSRIAGLLDRVLGSLAVDSGDFQTRFGFTPPFTSAEGLRITGEWVRWRANVSST